MQGNFTVDTYAALLGVQGSLSTKALLRLSSGREISLQKNVALDMVKDGDEFTLEMIEGKSRKLRNGDTIPEDRPTLIVHV